MFSVQRLPASTLLEKGKGLTIKRLPRFLFFLRSALLWGFCCPRTMLSLTPWVPGCQQMEEQGNDYWQHFGCTSHHFALHLSASRRSWSSPQCNPSSRPRTTLFACMSWNTTVHNGEGSCRYLQIFQAEFLDHPSLVMQAAVHKQPKKRMVPDWLLTF